MDEVTYTVLHEENTHLCQKRPVLCISVVFFVEICDIFSLHFFPRFPFVPQGETMPLRLSPNKRKLTITDSLTSEEN